MAPDDISADNPASETEGNPKADAQEFVRSIGPESEDGGGSEAPANTLNAPRRPRFNVGGAIASDPPKPPGQPPEIPDPDAPTPIEEPPGPIPVPPDDPPPPILAASLA